MKTFKRILMFLLIVIMLILGILIGFARRSDIYKLTLGHEPIKKVTDFIEKLGTTAHPTYREEVPGTVSSENTVSKQSPSQIKGYSGEKIKVARDGKTYTIRKDFKEAMDSYEKIFEKYADMMKNPNSPDYMANYLSLMSEYAKFGEEMDRVEDDLTEDENAYCLLVTIKIEQMMISGI